MNPNKQKQFPVPDSLMVAAINKVITETNSHPDRFKTLERRMLKQFLGSAYAHVDEDDLGARAVILRKRSGAGVLRVRDLNKQGGSHGGSKTPMLSQELKDHYLSPQYRELSTRVIAKASNCCQVCNGMATECHHRSYANLKTCLEELDLIAVCRRCHKVCDARRRCEAGLVDC